MLLTIFNPVGTLAQHTGRCLAWEAGATCTSLRAFAVAQGICLELYTPPKRRRR